MTQVRSITFLAGFAAVALLAACGGSDASPTNPVAPNDVAPKAVRLSPSAINVGVGKDFHTEATASATDGTTISGKKFTIVSNNATIATYNAATGVVHGVAPGSTTLTVTSGGVSTTIPVTVSTVAQGTFTIDLRFINSVPAVLRDAATRAATRWQQVITASLIPYHVTANEAIQPCGASVPVPGVDENVTNMVIYVFQSRIDGRNNIVGQGAPCIIRDDAPQQTVIGFVQIDSADVTALSNAGLLDNLFLHEMGHVLGIGTLWGEGSYSGLVTGLGTTDPEFVGVNARTMSASLGFTPTAATPVPIENTGGDGVADGHWRGTTFGDELMTEGLVDEGNPLSGVTIGALKDLGYTVNLQAGDDFSILNYTSPLSFPGPTATMLGPMFERIAGPRYSTSRSGRLTRIAHPVQKGTIEKL